VHLIDFAGIPSIHGHFQSSYQVVLAVASAKDAMEKYKRAVQAARKHVVPDSFSIVINFLHL